jgi:hypothetical protein
MAKSTYHFFSDKTHWTEDHEHDEAAAQAGKLSQKGAVKVSAQRDGRVVWEKGQDEPAA